MPKANFLKPDGTNVEVEASEGMTLMQLAHREGLDGIIGECGGNMACATCHVVVCAGFDSQATPHSPTENQMLDFTAMPREAGSRLSCQIMMSDELDGIVVRIADPQV